jgi:hypothetical protein
MIPEQPTEANVKPVLALMLPSLVYDLKSGGRSRTQTFGWTDKLDAALAEALLAAPEVATNYGTIKIASVALVHDPRASN